MKRNSEKDPFSKNKEEFAEIIGKIKLDTDVGIDTQLTHSIIINYLQQINHRLERLEKYIKSKENM
jgi:hypothetical protein